MTDTVKAISDRYFAAWEARDPDAIVALHTEDTTFWSHAGQEPAEGRAAVRQAFTEIFERFPGFGFETYRLLLGDRHWVLDWALTATLEEDGKERPIRFDCMDLVELSDDGLVRRKDTFVDMVQLQTALAG